MPHAILCRTHDTFFDCVVKPQVDMISSDKCHEITTSSIIDFKAIAYNRGTTILGRLEPINLDALTVCDCCIIYKLVSWFGWHARQKLTSDGRSDGTNLILDL